MYYSFLNIIIKFIYCIKLSKLVITKNSRIYGMGKQTNVPEIPFMNQATTGQNV
jgi:hypothetical protein